MTKPTEREKNKKEIEDSWEVENEKNFKRNEEGNTLGEFKKQKTVVEKDESYGGNTGNEKNEYVGNEYYLENDYDEGNKKGEYDRKTSYAQDRKMDGKQIYQNDKQIASAVENLMIFKNNAKNWDGLDYSNKQPIARNNQSVESKANYIEPISSITRTHHSFRRIPRISQNSIPMNSVKLSGKAISGRDVSGKAVSGKDLSEDDYSCGDPLSELRSIARFEADTFKDMSETQEESYFSPPVSPVKHPLSYLKNVITNEEGKRRDKSIVEKKIKPAKINESRKMEKDNISFELESELLELEGKLANDFDESIFNYNLENKLFYCPWEGCDKSFPSLSRIKRHYIIHTKLKPFKCLNKGCIRRFSRKDNMLQHYRVHCPFANEKS
jgi:uncharacterized Zn-finger protein